MWFGSQFFSFAAKLWRLVHTLSCVECQQSSHCIRSLLQRSRFQPWKVQRRVHEISVSVAFITCAMWIRWAFMKCCGRIVCVYVVTLLNQTPIFVWCVVGWRLQNKDTCRKKTGICHELWSTTPHSLWTWLGGLTHSVEESTNMHLW